MLPVMPTEKTSPPFWGKQIASGDTLYHADTVACTSDRCTFSLLSSFGSIVSIQSAICSLDQLQSKCNKLIMVPTLVAYVKTSGCCISCVNHGHAVNQGELQAIFSRCPMLYIAVPNAHPQ